MNSNNFSLFKVVLYMAALTLVMASPAFATPMVDGNVTSGEGYTFIDVPLYLKNSTDLISGGKLGYADSNGFLYFGLILPQSIADNSYGTSAQGYVDQDGLSIGRTLADMEKSDKLEFKYGSKDDETKLELDYIAGADGKYSAAVKKFERKQKFYDAEGNKTEIKTQFALEAFATSLDYNLNHSGTIDYTNSPTDGDWIDAIVYEFSVSKNVFEGIPIDINDFFDLNNSKIHVSPSKVAEKDIYARVPESQTLLFLGFGLIGLLGFGRKGLFRKS